MDSEYTDIPAELRERTEAFLDECGAVARVLVGHAFAEGAAHERRALVEHVDVLIAQHTEVFESLDDMAKADIEAAYAGMPGSSVANAQAGGAAEVLFSLRQRLAGSQGRRRDE